jgi:hypothetical protein
MFLSLPLVLLDGNFQIKLQKKTAHIKRVLYTA